MRLSDKHLHHRVLLVAYHFPPIGGSGVQRPTKFVKYLPRFGWHSYIICTDQPFGDGSGGWDETLLADIPQGTSVWRIPTPQPHPVQWLARRVGWKRRNLQVSGTSPTGEAVPIPARANLAKRLRRLILAPLYWIEQPPVDPALYWSLRIVPFAKRIIEQENIDVILTTVPPFSVLLSGYLLKILTKRPWVADFRDPWTDNTFTYFPTRLRLWLDRHLERFLVSQSDAVISVTEPWLEQLRGKVSATARRKPFVLIPNGWDRDDFPELGVGYEQSPAPNENKRPIVLLHPGSAYLEEPLPLLRAMERLDDETLSGLLFHFVGYLHPIDRARIQASPFADRFLLQSQRIPHPEALRLMRNAHVLLLLLLRKGPGASSGKIFEYMVSGRPVLAIGRGVAEQIIRECGIGATVHPDDPVELAGLLYEAVHDYAGFVRRYYRPNWEAINSYERSVLTARLAEVLDTVCMKYDAHCRRSAQD
ncbi:MAG: glycosyltransferase [Candidatus Methanomethyliaceae archaeon]